MELGWNDIVIDKRAVQAKTGDLIADWLWLIPPDAEPLLPTACDDLFLRLADGSVALLDTYAGSCKTLAPSHERWKVLLGDAERMDEWFKIGLVVDLSGAGIKRGPGECFSPLLPQIINGSWEPSNFHACSLLLHLSMLGQIHRQTKDLPPGTKISGFNVVKE